MSSGMDVQVEAEVEFDEDDVATKDSKKRPRSMEERRLICNLKSFIDENIDKLTAFNTNNVPKLIGKKLGVSKTTVQRFLNDNPETYQTWPAPDWDQRQMSIYMDLQLKINCI